MLHNLLRIRPETLRVWAAAKEHQRRLGELPSTEMVERLATAEGASPTACLALIRYELRGADGSVVMLGEYGCAPAVVPDAETCHAIMVRGIPAADLRTDDGRRMKRHQLDTWADVWEKHGAC